MASSGLRNPDWRRGQEANLLGGGPHGFQDHRLTVRPTLQLAEDVGVEPTRRFRGAGLANLCLSRSGYPPG